jgi:hypothetical protein
LTPWAPGELDTIVGSLGGKTITGQWWHQGPNGRPFLFCPDPSHGPGRYHRAGGPGAWYASSSMRASWCELFRHFMDGPSAIDPFEVKRRAGRVKVTGLAVLDLCDVDNQVALRIADDDLVEDDYAICQELSDAARAAGLDGVLAPSAGLAGQRTIALFPAAVDGGQVVEQRSRVQVPPIDLVDVLDRVRPTPAGRSGFNAYVTRLRRMGRAARQKHYRRR